MAKKPEDRYQTPAELAAALEPFCQGDAGPSTPIPVKKKKSGIPPPADPTAPSPAAPAIDQTYRPTRSVREDVTPTEPPATNRPRLLPPVAQAARPRFKKRVLVLALAAAVVLGLLLLLVWPRKQGRAGQPGNSTQPSTKPGTAPVAPPRSPLNALSRERPSPIATASSCPRKRWLSMATRGCVTGAQ